MALAIRPLLGLGKTPMAIWMLAHTSSSRWQPVIPPPDLTYRRPLLSVDGRAGNSIGSNTLRAIAVT